MAHAATSSLASPQPGTVAPRPSVSVAVLGSTGSIGQSTLEVIAASAGKMRVGLLAGHTNTALLLDQAQRYRPRCLVVTDPVAAHRQDWSDLPRDVQLCIGSEALLAAVADDDLDVVVSAIVGSAGLRSTWAALEAGKRVALANKETLVMAGPLVLELARRRHAALVPVDSEHSALFQALQAGRKDEVRRVVLTASGGPFRRHTAEQLERVTVDEALAHPTWNMGKKISVDSATMMNKALEIIEARWLFDLRPEQISVVIHPQSVVHSLVEFVDGSVLAQLSPPDMKLPIQYAITYPERVEGIARRMDWSQRQQLEFEPPDAERFPAIGLGLEVAARGGSAGAVLNAANEAAVAAFLAGQLAFPQIVPLCRKVVEQHRFEPNPALERLMELDQWARAEVTRWVAS